MSQPDVDYAFWWPAHWQNWGYRDGAGNQIINQPRAWVIHTPEERADNYPGTPYWFANPAAGASTQYFVSYWGFVWQMVEERFGPYANGLVGMLKPAIFGPGSLNLQTLSVEVEGYAATIGETMSEGQWKALVMLVRDRCLAYGIPMDREHIIGHYEVANNRTDPGTLDLDDLVRRLNQGGDDMTDEAEIRRIAEDHLFNILANPDAHPSSRDALNAYIERVAVGSDLAEIRDAITSLQERLAAHGRPL